MKFYYTKNPESEFFLKDSKSNKKKNSGGLAGRGGGVARVSDFFSFFFVRFWRLGGEGWGWG